MKNRRVLVVVLLAVSFCFIPLISYGEVQSWMNDRNVPLMQFKLLEARVDFIMSNPNDFTDISIAYDEKGAIGKQILGDGFDTAGMIAIRLVDRKAIFSNLSGMSLKEEFKKRLAVLYSFIKKMATDMNNDVVAVFYTKEDVPLGYFYRGEYHLWGN